MKVIKFLANPGLIALVFCFLLISGKAMGGVYLLYLILGLPHGAVHSLLGVAAIIFLCLTISTSEKGNGIFLKIFFQIAGISLAILSIVSFFYLDRSGYNLGTFEQTVPIMSFTILAICIVAFLIHSIWKIRRNQRNLESHSA